MTANHTTTGAAGANPTPSMIDAGLTVFCEHEPGDGTTGSEIVAAIWLAMQSAALTESACSDSRRQAQWDQRLSRYQALLLLFEADDLWGPLAVTTAREEGSSSLIRMTARQGSDRGPRAKWEAEHAQDYDQHERELARHMATIYDPLIEAGLALVRTPAPDLAAVRVKHDACNADGFRLVDYEDEEGELFGIIRADVKRLTGIEA